MLTVNSVDAGYGDGTVLHSVDLHVPAGVILAIVGPNGAGKTTLIHTIAGLLRPTSGRIYVDGIDVTGRPAHRTARSLGVALVPQGRRVFASLTVAEHLTLAHRRRRSRPCVWTPRLILELFPPLAIRQGHRASQLSGGEQQMLAISRALLAQPRLLLLDEPTEGLAPTIADRIVGLMKELVAERIAVVMTAPQADLAAGLAHEILALRAGRIIARFTGAEIRADPAKLHTVLVPSSTSVKYQRGGQLDNRPLSADVPILDAHSQRGELRQ